MICFRRLGLPSILPQKQIAHVWLYGLTAAILISPATAIAQLMSPLQEYGVQTLHFTETILDTLSGFNEV